MPQPQAREKSSLAELASAVRNAPRAQWPKILRQLRADERAGVAKLVVQLEQRKKAYADETQRLGMRLRFERPLWGEGITCIAGVDEVGVGPLAGPVVAAAVILPVRPRRNGVDVWPGLDDSKRLGAALRRRLAEMIEQHALATSIGQVDVAELDRLGIGRASVVAMERAVTGLTRVPEHLLVDARRLAAAPCPQTPIIGGDGRSLSIAAASVIAKEHRDALMTALALRHPGYGFEAHAGYGTPAHLAALERLGPSPVHRRSFAPVARLLGPRARQLALL